MENAAWEPIEKALFRGPDGELRSSDPEFAEFFSKFAFDEVPKHLGLKAADAYLAVLASLIGCQGLEVFTRIAGAVVSGPRNDEALQPIQLREMVYQAAAYLGIGRTLPYIEALDRVFRAAEVALPLPDAGVVSDDTRLTKGEEKQIEIFGEQMRGFAENAPQERRNINTWLVDNCFGDYYTRSGLDAAQREMITFCFLAAQGGCEPQLTSHAAANMRVGNSKEFLIEIICTCLPYVGYPRSLNALQCVQNAAEKQQG